MQKWFKVSLIVEIAFLVASGAAVGWFFWIGGGMTGRGELVCEIAINLFSACLLAVLIELLSVKQSAKDEASKIRRNDDLAQYYISRFSKLYFEMTFADKAALSAARKNLDFARGGGVGHIRTRDIPLEAMRNLFLPSDFVGGFYSKMLVEEFFDNETRLIDCFRRGITSLDYEHFGKLRDTMLAFVKAATDFSCSAEIRNTLRRRLDDRKMTEVLAEWFADGTFAKFRADVLSTATDGTGNPMLPYVVFCERLARERDLLVAYEKAMDEVRAVLPRK